MLLFIVGIKSSVRCIGDICHWQTGYSRNFFPLVYFWQHKSCEVRSEIFLANLNKKLAKYFLIELNYRWKSNLTDALVIR